jgi:putative DNA primase/helicase
MGNDTELSPADILLDGTDFEKYRFLAALPVAAYERLRVCFAEKMGIRVGVLDIEVVKRRKTGDKTLSLSLTLSEPESWPEEVSGQALLDAIEGELGKYLVMSESARMAVTLWIVMTYVVESLFILPLLLVTSPQKRCGKSTLMILLHRLCRKPLLASNTSKAALFRIVEAHTPTLLLDEADSWARDDDELRGIINCGHSRDTAGVFRCDGDQLEPRLFDTFCPKVLAGIGTLPDTIQDRAVIIQMRRRAPNESVVPLRPDKLDLDHLRSMARSWAEQHLPAIKEADPSVPTGLHDRAADNWRPLLAIADLAGGTWPERARQAAKALSATDNDDDDIRAQLLADIHCVFAERGELIASADLVQYLTALEARPWGDWKHGRPLSAVQLARLLSPFGISTFNVKDGIRVYKAYDRAGFNDAFSRYLKPEDSSATPLPGPELRENGRNPSASVRTRVADRAATSTGAVAAQNGEISGGNRGSSGVAALRPQIEVLEI